MCALVVVLSQFGKVFDSFKYGFSHDIASAMDLVCSYVSAVSENVQRTRIHTHTRPGKREENEFFGLAAQENNNNNKNESRKLGDLLAFRFFGTVCGFGWLE